MCHPLYTWTLLNAGLSLHWSGRLRAATSVMSSLHSWRWNLVRLLQTVPMLTMDVQKGDDQAGEGREGADQQLQSCCHSCPGHVNLNLHGGKLRGSFRKCMSKEHASNDNMTFPNTFADNK